VCNQFTVEQLCNKPSILSGTAVDTATRVQDEYIFLAQVFLKANVDLSGLTNLILAQKTVGSTIKARQCTDR